MRFIKKSLLFFFKLFPASWSYRFFGDKVIILLYHEIAPKLFKEHLTFLKREYNIISLHDFCEWHKGVKSLPPNSLVITFDDGWQSNYSLLPTIKETKIPVTIFLPMGLINTNRKIWNYSLDRTGKDRDLNKTLKTVSDKERKAILKDYNGHYNEKEYPDRDFLTFAEIREMEKYVDFQSHGMFHPVLTKLDDDNLKIELEASKREIENTFSKPCYCIAYPYGRTDARVAKFARESGYDFGRVSAQDNINSRKTDRMFLKAVGISERKNIESLKSSLLWAKLRSLFLS